MTGKRMAVWLAYIEGPVVPEGAQEDPDGDDLFGPNDDPFSPDYD